jgi:DNA-binding CsgD family transcriptional regulator
MVESRTVRGPSARLHGRDPECASLDALLADVRGGHSSVLLLRGEPGIGKSALLQYLVERGSGLTLLRCAGVQSQMELAFSGLYELCSPILDGLDSLPTPQSDALGIALGLTAGESPDKFLVALGALGLLSAASEHGPVICIVEDGHWLDQASAQVLGFVGRRLLAEPVGMVIAARAPVAAPDHLVGLPELRIAGVDGHAARALLDSVGGMRVDDSILARIIDETHGNPLALLELGARMMAAGSAGGFEAVDAASLTNRIEDEYLAQLNALPRDTQQLVLLASADPVCDTALIQRAAGQLGLGVDAVDLAIEADLLSVGESVRFRHPLLRSAVYWGADDERRRAAHDALAAASDQSADADRRAWHRAYATAGPDEEVAGELIESAARAQARGGFAAAAAFWERAVALTADGTDRSARALVAAQAKFAAGDLDATGRLLAESETGTLGEFEQAIAELLRAQVAFTRTPGDAPALLLGAANLLRGLNIDLARLAYLQAMIATGWVGRLGDRGLRLAIARASKSLPLDPIPTATQLLIRGIATWLADGYVAGASTLKEAIRQHLNDSPDPDFVGFAFKVMAINLGDDDAWFSMITGQAKLARERGMLSWVPFTVDGPAEFAVHSGNLAEGEVLLLEAGLIDPTTTAATTPRLALLVAAWRGDAAAAEKPLQMLTKAAATQGHGFLLAYADYAKSVLYNGLGDYPSAADVAESASADALDCVPFPVFTLPELVEAAAYSDQPERARVASEQLTEVAIASGSDFARGKAAHARALVTDGESADAPYQEAIELLSKTRMAIHVARARLGYGRWLRSMNRRTDARAQLRSAHESFVAMGAAAFAAQARRELRATGERVRRRSGSTNAELTPQEEQIAQLARDRRTNPEIGAQLFLSARTVEWHLRKIFGKLEITSRRELDAALTRRGRL